MMLFVLDQCDVTFTKDGMTMTLRVTQDHSVPNGVTRLVDVLLSNGADNIIVKSVPRGLTLDQLEDDRPERNKDA